jgi:hypothetical protein
MWPKTAGCRNLFSTSNCQCRLFSKKIPIIRIFRITGELAVPLIRISGVPMCYTIYATYIKNGNKENVEEKS